MWLGGEEIGVRGPGGDCPSDGGSVWQLTAETGTCRSVGPYSQSVGVRVYQRPTFAGGPIGAAPLVMMEKLCPPEMRRRRR